MQKKALSILVILVITFILIGSILLTQLHTHPSEASSHWQYHQHAVYIAPADDLPVPMASFAQLGVKVVPTYEDLIDWERNGNEVRIIYLHPEALGNIDKQHLQQAYRDGVVLVAINTPLSLLAEAAKTRASIDDLRPEYYSSDEYITAAMILRTASSESNRWTYHDFFLPANFEAIPGLIESRLNYQEEQLR